LPTHSSQPSQTAKGAHDAAVKAERAGHDAELVAARQVFDAECNIVGRRLSAETETERFEAAARRCRCAAQLRADSPFARTCSFGSSLKGKPMGV
jgi:hypothetical protein